MVKGRQTVRLPPKHRKADGTAKDEPEDDAVTKAASSHPLSLSNILKVTGLAAPLLTLAALNTPISQATLAPVYGSIPSSVNHVEAITATVLLGFIWRHFLKGIYDEDIIPYLALWTFWMPVFELYLFQYSDSLGPVLGAIVTGFVSCHTVIIPSAYAAAQALEACGLDEQLGNIVGSAIPAIMLDLAYFRPVEHAFSQLLPSFTTWSSVFTPVKLQYLIACTYALISPTKPYWMFTLSIPALFHAFLANPHFDSSRTLGVANRDLALLNWTIVDRQWSNTGYVSVVESSVLQYRSLRCDHSLLGGEWLLTDERRTKEGWLVNEPIYAVFEMLEAVRLVEVEPSILDTGAQALVVGLGIGTAPKALMAHGINTTIVELDPLVHRYAMKYFDLPKEHTAVIQDAVSWVSSEAAANATKYDYILHDVFTGGAEPLPLFTDAFLTDLRGLLKPNGVVALNYAGDLSMPLTGRILNTIHHTFDGQCKIFRDAPAPAAKGNPEGGDFLNMVVFCRNSPGSITFRQPTRKDYLGSKSRQHYLLPQADHEIAFPSAGEDEVLRKGKEGQWKKQQEESAIRHWHIMRRVLPAAVWETW